MYCLDLSIIYKIYSVFYVFFLKLYNRRFSDDFIFNYLLHLSVTSVLSLLLGCVSFERA